MRNQGAASRPPTPAKLDHQEGADLPTWSGQVPVGATKYPLGLLTAVHQASRCPPRRGGRSLAVGETHGTERRPPKSYRPRRGRTSSPPTWRQTPFNPFGVGKPSTPPLTVG